jgi:hypothetical protein
MTRTKRAAALASASAVALTLVSPGLAQAEDAAPLTLSRAGLGAARTSVDNEFFAGYVSELKRDKSIVGTFTVPTLDCGARDEGIMSIIEIASTGGVDYADGAVFSYCQGGVPTHNPVFDISTGQIPIPEIVEDGDKIKVTSTVNASGTIKIKVENLSQDWIATQNVTGIPAEEASSLQYRFDLGDGVTLPAYDYGTLPVKGVKIGGKPLSKTNPTKYNIVIDGDPIIKPGKIKKTDFKYAYVG